MRVLFFGTPEFAATTLRALMDSEHEVVGVISQPDRRRGRRGAPEPPPVAQVALDHDLPLTQPKNARGDDLVRWANALRPDVGVVVAYGHILPTTILDLPRLGCVNVHASLLPRWRGASPIQAAIVAGDAETGVGIMQMDEGLDTGDILHEVRLPLTNEETASSLHDQLAVLGAEALVHTLGLLERGEGQPRKQTDEGCTYASRLSKTDGDINWGEPAEILHRKIRGLHPWPGTRTLNAEGLPLKLLPPVSLGPSVKAAPGTIVAADGGGITVACGGETSLVLQRLQAAGRKALDAQAFLAGNDIQVGSTWG